MARRKSAATDAAETETAEERRADLDDQPVKLAEAEEAGTLPDEDRRSDGLLSAVASTDLTNLPRSTDSLLASLPLGWKATFTRGEHANTWTVSASPSVHGESKTLARAKRLIGAQQVHDESGKTVLVDSAGLPIEPD